MEINLNPLEKKRSGFAVTKNYIFEKYGYIHLPNFVDVNPLVEKINLTNNFCVDDQVTNSIARYHSDNINYTNTFELLTEKIEEIIGCKLYKTYFFDRIYYEGNELKNHLDRESCEISMTVHIDSNPKDIEWPFFIKSPDGESCSVLMKPGDAVLYKGHERPHWREPLTRSMSKTIDNNTRMMYHQVFFHYVLANGCRAHHANDSIFKNYKRQ
jgi:hypothetical protein